MVEKAKITTAAAKAAILTPEAMTQLSSAIYAKKREQREVLESWAKIIGAVVATLTGLVGAVIGLIAVAKK